MDVPSATASYRNQNYANLIGGLESVNCLRAFFVGHLAIKSCKGDGGTLQDKFDEIKGESPVRKDDTKRTYFSIGNKLSWRYPYLFSSGDDFRFSSSALIFVGVSEGSILKLEFDSPETRRDTRIAENK